LARPADEALSHADAPLQAFWIGHATVLLRMEDRWLITDPIFADSIAGVLRRRVAPGIDLSDMPALDWILISHAHFDHLDIPSLGQLDACAQVAAPPDVVQHLPDERTPRVAALEPWRSVVDRGMTITAVPVKHGDDRYMIDTMWNHQGHTGYLIRYRNMTVVFAGDTGYDEKTFRDVGRSFDVDLALLPVGPVGGLLRPLNRRSHMDPDEAMQALSDVGARWMLPIHFGTFFRPPAPEREAVVRAVVEHRVEDRVIVLSPGQSVTLEPRAWPRAGPAARAPRAPSLGSCSSPPR
jgi:L-ascorbate metabolism protein UlaG (beta-lactamase superfamily)